MHTISIFVDKTRKGLNHSQNNRNTSRHRTRPLLLPIRLQSGLISVEKCISPFHAVWCRSVLESRKDLMSEQKSSLAMADI